MRVPHVRFTMRRMMVAVAIAGVVLGARRKSVALQQRAAVHATQEQEWLATASIHQQWARRSLNLTGMLRCLRQAESDRSFVEYCRRRADYSARLRRKYERLSWRPWLPIEPDPPVPK